MPDKKNQMATKKEKSKSTERYTFTEEELQRLKNQLEEQIVRSEIIGLLDRYSASFADWSGIISEAIHETMTRKQQSNIDCEKERKMLDTLSFFFTRLAFFSDTLSEWHERLKFSNELTEKMIKERHP